MTYVYVCEENIEIDDQKCQRKWNYQVCLYQSIFWFFQGAQSNSCITFCSRYSYYGTGADAITPLYCGIEEWRIHGTEMRMTPRAVDFPSITKDIFIHYHSIYGVLHCVLSYCNAHQTVCKPSDSQTSMGPLSIRFNERNIGQEMQLAGRAALGCLFSKTSCISPHSNEGANLWLPSWQFRCKEMRHVHVIHLGLKASYLK